MSKIQRPFGVWDSPVTPRWLAATQRLEAARYDSDGKTLVWLAGRSGQGVLIARTDAHDAPRDLTGDRNVRAEVGYGGGDFTVHGGCVYFVDKDTRRLFRQAIAGGSAEPITPKQGQVAAPTVSPDGRWLAFVHHDDDDQDRLAVVDTRGQRWPQIMASGCDFYMQPRWSPDGKRLAWIQWEHPNMPWDGTTLCLADVVCTQEQDAPLPRLASVRTVAGDADTAVSQPEFTPDGDQLLFVSDQTGWSRLAAWDCASARLRWLTDEGFEAGGPAWLQDMRSFAISHDGRCALVVLSRNGFQQLHRVELPSGDVQRLECLQNYTSVTQIVAAPNDDRLVMIGSSTTTPPRLIECAYNEGQSRVVARTSGETTPPEALADCEPIQWDSAGGEIAHGLFYAPHNHRFEDQGKPPLIVLVHGGPTSQVVAAWHADAQFLATRGYAVLMVNYRGSTGYGRAYMQKLRGNWGVCDVEDAVAGAEYLARNQRADPQRTVIMGGSAGGFTVLQTMVSRPEAFAAGICLYGVADQFHLAAETHKFESRYLDSLLGTLPAASAVYRARSPIYHAQRICRPLALFQGDIDRVVPRHQSDVIVAALKTNNTPHQYHVYAGEGHGWRKRETIEHFYEHVDQFLRQHVVFGPQAANADSGQGK